MFWFALAALAMSAAQAKSQANSQAAGNSQSYTASLKGVEAQNEAIEAANTSNLIRTGYRVGLVNLQTAKLKQQAIEQGYDTSVKGVAALGATQAQAAASGTVGSSVDAAQLDIQKKVDEAENTVDQNFADILESANMQIEQTVMQGQDAQRSPIDVNDTVPTSSDPGGWKAALAAGAGTALSLYGSQSISLGKTSAAKLDLSNSAAYQSTLVGPYAFGSSVESSGSGLIAR